MRLKPQEKYLIMLIRDIGFGEITIKIQEKLPHRIVRYEESILLEDVIKVGEIETLDCREVDDTDDIKEN